MAEERLLDNDLNKDKKYKIRKNADGEDELYLDDTPDEEDKEESVFEIPEFGFDDEEAAVLTPEQLLLREQARREEEERRAKIVAENLEKCEQFLAASDFDNALYHISVAEEVAPDNSRISFLKVKALSKNMTDLTRLEDLTLAAEGVKKYCNKEEKAELLSISAPIKRESERHEERAAELHVENEAKKAERREVFRADAKRATIWFSATALPFLLFLILAIAFSTVMFASKEGTNLVITIVFAALALVAFIATVFTTKALWAARRKLSLNEKNSSTKLGREYEEELAKVEGLNKILSAFKED